jgi:hypothetical protein
VYRAFRRDRDTRGGGVFICVKKCIPCVNSWADKDFEMIAVEVRGTDAEFTWEIVGIYRARNEGMLVIERLAAITDPLGKYKNRRIIEGH